MSDVIEMYMTEGEKWENNPMAYVEAIGENRDVFKAALIELDAAKMVSTWSDDTLFDVEVSGSDLGLDKATRKKVNDAAKLERSQRSPAVVPDRNGMAENGAQKVKITVSDQDLSVNKRTQGN